MKKSIAFLVIVDMMFIIIAAVPTLISGWSSGFIYYALYAALIAFAALFVKGEKTALRFSLLPARPVHALALFAPTMLLIIAISFLSSSLLALLGKSDIEILSDPLIIELFRHALLPAVFEEMLFRYIPIKLLGGRSPRAAIIVSSLMFAFVHLSFFRIPYALLAGAIFAYITILTGSILPSMILHFINNSVSVVWMRNPEAAPIVIFAILALSALSLCYIIVRRRDYLKSLKDAASGERVGFSFEIIIAAAVCFFAAMLELG